jgi:hypothetical protein
MKTIQLSDFRPGLHILILVWYFPAGVYRCEGSNNIGQNGVETVYVNVLCKSFYKDMQDISVSLLQLYCNSLRWGRNKVNVWLYFSNTQLPIEQYQYSSSTNIWGLYFATYSVSYGLYHVQWFSEQISAAEANGVVTSLQKPYT